MTPIPTGTIRCVVRAGDDRRIVHQSDTPLETKLDVAAGFFGMGVFRIDYIGVKWMLGYELLTVDVDLDRVTAPSEPPVISEPPVAPELPVVATTLFRGVGDLSPERAGLLQDEIIAIERRVEDVISALGIYKDAAGTAVRKKFGLDKLLNVPAPKDCFLLVQECVMAFPEMYLYEPLPLPADAGCVAITQTAHARLKEHLRDKSLVIVGGVPIVQRLDWIEKILGVRPEWLETSPNGNPSLATAMSRQMKDGKIGALIIANGLIRHNTFYGLRDSAAANNIPLAFALKAGNGQLGIALDQLERILRQRAVGGDSVDRS